ncbi:dihydroorotase [Fundicoccus sp. Sow4_D5]|uniref:dihydroorotase n=1 Tax=unclassified Fundicoccus TaxID=2761543 RepID=UPI003F916998
MNLILKNGKRLVGENQLESTDVLIEDGKIIKIGQALEGTFDRTIDLNGQLITSGLTDIHVHFREPGFTEKETILSGSKAAARGGFTTVAAMPNTNPVPDTVEKFNEIQDIIERDAVVKVLQYAPITTGLKSDELVDMAGINAFAYTNDGVGVQTAGVMYQAMKLAASLDKPIVAHTEDNSLLYGGVMHEGLRNQELGLPGILSIVESSQIARDIHIAEATGCHYHVCHVSAEQSVASIREGKKRGVRVTGEVTPHHLILSELDILEDDATYKMNPPLRSAKDREALIEALLDGTLDFIATDHAPHTNEEKSNGFKQSPFGIVGIETSFALMYTHFVKTGRMSLEFLLNRMGQKPAELFNLPVAQLAVGATADLAVFDLDSEYTIDPGDYLSKSSNTPFNGHRVYGMCSLTIVKGEIVWQADVK